MPCSYWCARLPSGWDARARVFVDVVGLDDAAARERLLEKVREIASQPVPPAPPLDAGLSGWGRPLAVAPTGLPLAASLIGRERELADLMARLRAGTAIGLFALRGMGGVGKTALTAEAVARLAEEQTVFPGGAVWITCEGLEGEAVLAELWARVARALQLEQVAGLNNIHIRFATLAR